MAPNKQDVYDSILSDMIKFADRVDIIKETFLTCYTIEIAGNVSTLAAKECYGCEINHPSQRRHDCIMMPGDMRMLAYFDKAKENDDSVRVMKEFVKALRNRNIELEVSEMIQFTYNSCYNLFCSSPKQKKIVEERTHELVSYNSFY